MKDFESDKSSLHSHLQRRDAVPRAAIRLGLFALIAATIWAHFTELPEIAYASGRLEPESAIRRIEHPDGGIVMALPRAEGDIVRQGDLLIRLAPDDIDAELQSLSAQQAAAVGAQDRARTLLRLIGTDPFRPPLGTDDDPGIRARLDAYRARRARLSEQLRAQRVAIEAAALRADHFARRQRLAEADATRTETLHTKGLVSDRQLFEAQAISLETGASSIEARDALAAAQSKEVDARDALIEFHAQTRDVLEQEAIEAEDTLKIITKSLAEAHLRRARLSVAMPIDGIIQTLHLRTLGEVLDAGGLIAEFLPAGEELIAVVDLQPLDAGHVRVGQRVDLRLTTFSIKKYGTLGGYIERISPTTYEDETGQFSYRLRLRLDRQSIGEAANTMALRPGIEVNAAIMTGSRSVLEYALSPVADPLKEAFVER